MSTTPQRGFSLDEFEQRTQRAQKAMRSLKLDVLLLTTEPDVRYFSGFFTQFWLSPTRPWFLLLPLDGKPVAVIPGIGEVGMQQTWIDDIRCWPSPRPGDEGVSLLSSSVRQFAGRFSRIGISLGPESHLRMPAADFKQLENTLPGLEIVDCSRLITEICAIKSASEVEKIQYVCELTSDSFAAIPNFARIGDTEREVVKKFRIDLLQRGADHSPYIVSASGVDGYDNIIMGPTGRTLRPGDILIIDTGTQFDGYYCDFDRNYAFGSVSDSAKSAYETVFRSTDAGFAAAKPGATTRDLWQAMWTVLEAGGAQGNDVGRLGHGLGMQLTEWPSIMETNPVMLRPGMVMTLEPGMRYDGDKQMVHEENILITQSGAVMLSKRAPEEFPVI